MKKEAVATVPRCQPAFRGNRQGHPLPPWCRLSRLVNSPGATCGSPAGQIVCRAYPPDPFDIDGQFEDVEIRDRKLLRRADGPPEGSKSQ